MVAVDTLLENKASAGTTDAERAASSENGKEDKNDQKSAEVDPSAPGSENDKAGTAAPENGEVPPGGEEKTVVDDKLQENVTQQNNQEKADNVVSPPGGNSKKRKRKPKKANAGTAPKLDIKGPPSEQKAQDNNEQANKEGQPDKGKPAATGENSRRNKRKKAAIASAKDTGKPDSSTKEGAGRKDSMGMIFMCSSKTKQDCYRYKVLGLPAAKKDMVAKIYKGMRLFLFDVDLKLLYGIYKAAEQGGYNIEPKAFKSAFPSQVRFSVIDDCLPLPEEKFKAVIKDNYYGKNKFDCQLKAEQVKNLCKLFKANTGKSRESKHVERVRKSEGQSFADRSRESRQSRRHDRYVDRRPGQERERRQGRDRVRSHAFSEIRRGPEPDVIYETQPYASVIPPSRLPLRLAPAYPYERPMDIDYHRRDTQLERHDRRLGDLELGRREELVYHDPHGHIEPPPFHDRHLSYPEPLYTRALPSHEPPLSHHELLYSRPPPVHETHHESVYARDAPPVYLLPHAGYRY